MPAAVAMSRTRAGRRTHYSVNTDSVFRHPAQEGLRIGPFLALLATATTAGTESADGTR